MRKIGIFWLILTAFVTGTLAFRQQSVGIRGKLMCGDEPIKGAKLKLINHNTVGFDDQLAETSTDEKGNYEMNGGLGALFSLDVKLKIYTSCETNFLNPCQREITLGIPGSYVTRTEAVQNYFNGGTLNMQFQFKNEGTKCL